MEIKNFKLNPILSGAMIVLGSTAFGASASMVIVTDADRFIASQTDISTGISHNFLAPRELAASIVTASFKEMPLLVVLSNVVPNDYELDLMGNLGSLEVTWSGSDKWDSILRELSSEHNLLVHVSTDPNKISIAKIGDNVESVTDLSGLPDNSRPVNVVDCDSSECVSGKVDIEKLVLDTSWTAVEVEKSTPFIFEEAEESDHLSHEELELSRLEKEAAAQSEQSEQLRLSRIDYEDSYVKHGKGSFEEFVNGGGLQSLQDGTLNPDEAYTYVYKQGTLFTSIEKWAEANGYTIKNDILSNHKRDYPNYTDVNLHGDFYSVTTALLNKYLGAEVPINHRFYTKGKVLHIFVGKYN
ncbi:conserved hypothetical protein [Vibrio chagasii]|nr:conserved hypothetical protein [Vibrio chagasii]